MSIIAKPDISKLARHTAIKVHNLQMCGGDRSSFNSYKSSKRVGIVLHLVNNVSVLCLTKTTLFLRHTLLKDIIQKVEDEYKQKKDGTLSRGLSTEK